MELSTIAFAVLGTLALAGGFGLILSRNPIYALLYTLLSMFAIAGLFLTLQAEFLAVVQVIVYAGAIMVLFLFVINLLNLTTEDVDPIKYDFRTILSMVLGLGFLLELLVAFRGTEKLKYDPSVVAGFSYGKVEPIGYALMTDYVFPFEMISVILLVALMGAVIIAKKYSAQ
jgi:NADH-quinone oxidoreductase subunit J